MNWEAIGASAELLGAIGVILSLVYLAKQIRANSEGLEHNAKLLQASVETASDAQTVQILKLQIESEEIADLCRRGHADYQSLNPIERHRYDLFLLAVFESHQTYCMLNERGGMDPRFADYNFKTFDRLCNVPGIIFWWQKNRTQFDSQFMQYIDEKIPE